MYKGTAKVQINATDIKKCSGNREAYKEWNLRFSLSNPIDPHTDHKINIQMSNFYEVCWQEGGSLGRLHYVASFIDI